MAKKLKSLATRVVIVVVIVHTVLLPLLFRGLLYIVEESHKQMFVDNVRTFSRFVADHAEEEFSKRNSMEVLDSIALCSNCVHSELWDGDKRLLQSPLNNQTLIFKEDFTFGEHEDNTYFLSAPLLIPHRQLILRLGFDEQPTNHEINKAYRSGILVLSVYFLLSLTGVVWMSLRLAKPLRFLQKSSRIIASGHFSDHLSVDSNILEIDELAKDLEFMRSELFQTNQELQLEIQQRHSEEEQRKVLEVQLLHSQKLEMIGTLSGGIAHEFNNILVPILLYTELARDELPDQSPIADDLSRVINSAERAKTLVQKILTFSRQGQEHQFKPIDLSSVIIEALQLLRAITPATISYHQHLDHFDDSVFGDEGQLQQVIVNLCNNAVKAINRGIGTIDIKLDEYIIKAGDVKEKINLPPGKYAHLSITDNGQGMENEILDRIFEPFFTTGDVGEGYGLGLSVVHGIVSSHKGEIRAFSTSGKGTIFDIYLPLISYKKSKQYQL